MIVRDFQLYYCVCRVIKKQNLKIKEIKSINKYAHILAHLFIQ